MEILIVIIFFFLTLSIGLILMLQSQKKRLEEEQARFQASVNSINVGFMIANTRSEVVMINTAAKQIIFNSNNTPSPAILRNSPGAQFHYSMDEIVTRLGAAYDLRAQIKKALTERTTVSDKNIPYGELFLHVFITPIVVLEGKGELGLEYIGAVVLIEDITQSLILERSKAEFFSIASHELRTPLTAIRGNASMIEQFYAGKLDPNLAEMIHDIHQSSIRLINIVKDFLDVSRLEQGRIEYHLAPMGLMGLAASVVKELSPITTQRGLYLNLEPPSVAPPIILADKERIKQVLVNLIGNALKFTTQGGITVRISTEGNFVKCQVIDTGKGIPIANQKLLFHKFQQASKNILSRDVDGTGLGLYISKLMIEGQGGKIYLERSVEGRGSIFSFVLPISKAQPPLVQAAN